MDPNFNWKKEPGNIEVFMEKELYLPASGALGVEQVANLAIVDIHKLAKKVWWITKDEYINGLLTAMRIDLTSPVSTNQAYYWLCGWTVNRLDFNVYNLLWF